MDRNIEKLIKYIRKEDVVLFIGSGFSIKAGAPTAYQLVNAIIQEGGEELFKDLSPEERTLRTVSELFTQDRMSRNELLTLLKGQFDFIPKDLSDHQMLRKIPHIRTIFTTNYDTLLEDSYPKSERNLVTATSGCAYYDSAEVTIYKVHGDLTNLNNPDSVIITESDYQHYFTNPNFTLIWEDLKSAFVKKHVVFVGYSLEDDNILELIKNVRSCLHENMKGLFLIAPNLKQSKQEQLRKNKVQYIDSYADNVLKSILSELKENIYTDLQTKKVTQETFSRFCDINGDFYPTITSSAKENKIDSVHIQNGKERKDEYKVTLPISVKSDIDNLNFKDEFKIDPLNTILPAIKIPSSQLGDFSYYVNGIKISGSENISSMLIAPRCEKMKLKIGMRSLDFKENVNAIRYSFNDTLHVNFRSPICVVKMEFNVQDGKDIKLNMTFERIETYTNYSDAIKWVDFFIGLFSGKQFSLSFDGFKLDKFNHIVNTEAITEYQEIKHYFEVIQEIERETDIEFDTYENYSESTYFKARCLLYYHKCLGFEMKCHNKKKFICSPEVFAEICKDSKENSDFLVTESIPLGEISLNGQKFLIPFKNIVYSPCTIDDVILNEQKQSEVTINIKDSKCVVWCSDTQPEQIGSKLRLCNKS